MASSIYKTVSKCLTVLLLYVCLYMVYFEERSPVITPRPVRMIADSANEEPKPDVKVTDVMKRDVNIQEARQDENTTASKATSTNDTYTKVASVKHTKTIAKTAKVSFAEAEKSKAFDCSVTKKRSDVIWTPYMDVLPVSDDLKSLAFPGKVLNAQSTVEIEDPKQTYQVGDEIRVNICVKYSPSSAGIYGGDDIRVRIQEPKKGAYASGYVIDHHDGNYTGVLKALWEGTPEIAVQMKHSRYEIAFLYDLRKKYLTIRTISGMFIYGKSSAQTICFPSKTKFDPNATLCDLTHANGGAPWFCERPKPKAYMCKHLQFMIRDDFDEAKWLAMGNVWTDAVLSIGRRINVTVKAAACNNSQRNELPLCHEYDSKALWTMSSPVGHFYKTQWHIGHCTPHWVAQPDINMKSCVRNKYFILFGDSTIMQWYSNMKDRFGCTGEPPRNAVTRELIAHNAALNMTVNYVRHNHPGNSIGPDTPDLKTKRGNIESSPLESFLDFVGTSQTPVFVIHLYFHYTYYFERFYRQRIKLLGESIRAILTNRSDARILVKGPHLITQKTLGTNDYFAYVYRVILLEELAEYLDRVVYLDYMDMTNAVQVPTVHPNKNVVREMVNQMIAYVCD